MKKNNFERLNAYSLMELLAKEDNFFANIFQEAKNAGYFDENGNETLKSEDLDQLAEHYYQYSKTKSQKITVNDIILVTRRVGIGPTQPKIRKVLVKAKIVEYNPIREDLTTPQTHSNRLTSNITPILPHQYYSTKQNKVYNKSKISKKYNQ